MNLKKVCFFFLLVIRIPDRKLCRFGQIQVNRGCTAINLDNVVTHVHAPTFRWMTLLRQKQHYVSFYNTVELVQKNEKKLPFDFMG